MSRRLALALDRVGSDLRIEEAVLAREGIAVEFGSDDPAMLSKQLEHAEALLVNKTLVNAALLDRAPRCAAVVTYGVGHDHIDLDEAARRGVIVANVPDYCTDEVADHTIALLLAVARGVVRGNALVHAGGWGADGLGSLPRLRGRVMGLLGYGRIAQAVAKRAGAFGMKVAAFDPAYPPGSRAQAGVALVATVDDLLSMSDVLSLHVPLLPTTERIINRAALKWMKGGAILVNTSRGGLVDVEALVEALDEGRLFGAALDVLPEEPPSTIGSLDGQNLVVTPHVAYFSVESQRELKLSAARAVADALSGRTPQNVLTQSQVAAVGPVGQPRV